MAIDQKHLEPQTIEPKSPEATPWYRRRAIQIGGVAASIVAAVGIAVGVGASQNSIPENPGPLATATELPSPNTSPSATETTLSPEAVTQEEFWQLTTEQRIPIFEAMQDEKRSDMIRLHEELLNNPSEYLQARAQREELLFNVGSYTNYKTYRQENPDAGWKEYVGSLKEYHKYFEYLDGQKPPEDVMHFLYANRMKTYLFRDYVDQGIETNPAIVDSVKKMPDYKFIVTAALVGEPISKTAPYNLDAAITYEDNLDAKKIAWLEQGYGGSITEDPTAKMDTSERIRFIDLSYNEKLKTVQPKKLTVLEQSN